MNNEFQKDNELDTLVSLDASADKIDDLENLTIEFLDRSAPLSNARRPVSIEELRERVAQSSRTIQIGEYNGKKRISILRNGNKLTTFLFSNDPGLTNEQIREEVRKRIIKGEFDNAITVVYDQIRSKQTQ